MAEVKSDDHFKATEYALDAITDQAIQHNVDPQTTLHQQSDQESSHAWIQRIFPYKSLQELENAFHMGNYVMDRSTGSKQWEAMSIYVRVGMHALYYGSEQEKALHWKRTLSLLKAQTEKMGRQYDTPESRAHIMPFVKSFALEDSMKDMVEPDPMSPKYTSFNDFFAREVRPDARPPAEPEDPLVVSSVADSRTTVFPTVDLATKYWIKGQGFSIARLLNDNELAERFDQGGLAIARLAPQDYHRWHCPVDGVIESITEIPGAYYTVNPQAINEDGVMDVFCENRRSVMVIRRSTGGAQPVAVVAVGAMLVGSIVYVPGVKIGATVRRGQCLGKFQYGGSTVITIFQKGGIEFDQDLVRNSTSANCETLLQVGWRIGRGGT